MNTGDSLPAKAEVVVVGGGLTGLACATTLLRAGVDVQLIEASDRVGGRVRTDNVDGFLLDHGFQVLLTAYEEVQAQMDMEALDLRPFRPGSMVWDSSELVTLSDPFREPASAFQAMRAPIGTLQDKFKVARLRQGLLAKPPSACFDGPDRTTLEELQTLRFSEGFIDRFFRPFLGGVFLERDLDTPARLFRYYFRCFSAGDVSLPAAGMEAIPRQLAKQLEGRIHVNRRAGSVSSTQVRLDSGEGMKAGQVVLATNAGAASRLGLENEVEFKANITAYFRAPEPPTDEALLILDGPGSGPANHIAVISNVAPTYAPPGEHLISVSGVGKSAADPSAFSNAAVTQLRDWFGDQVLDWTHLKTYRTAEALPKHPLDTVPGKAFMERPDGLIVAGDYLTFGSIQGALASGRRTAEHLADRAR